MHTFRNLTWILFTLLLVGGLLSCSDDDDTTAPPPQTQAPTGLSASAVSSSQIDLSWTDNSDNETGFKIERSATSGTSAFTQIATVDADEITYSDTDLAEDTQYWYRVRAANSASDSDWSNVATSTTSAVVQLPTIPAAELTTDVDFGSSDPNAQQAKTMVEGQLGLATALTTIGQPFFTPLDQANWHGVDDQCWGYTYSYPGCTWIYQVCRTDQEYEWTLTFNGTCGGAFPYVNWVAMHGTTSLDGTEGTMRLYQDHSTDVGASWAWSVAANGLSGTWTFYEGDVASENQIAHLDWQQNADGSQDSAWTWFGESRFEIHVAAGGNSGWMDFFEWNGDEWILYWKIVWNADGSGYWASYDESGEETSRETWTS